MGWLGSALETEIKASSSGGQTIIKRSHLSWLKYLISFLEVFRTCPTVRGPQGRPWTLWWQYISFLPFQQLGFLRMRIECLWGEACLTFPPETFTPRDTISVRRIKWVVLTCLGFGPIILPLQTSCKPIQKIKILLLFEALIIRLCNWKCFFHRLCCSFQGKTQEINVKYLLLSLNYLSLVENHPIETDKTQFLSML